MKKYLLILLITLHAFGSYLKAQTVVPISTGINPSGSYPNSFSKLRNNLYVFRANSQLHGDEPYVTDGTQGGTFLLKDINAGVESSDGYQYDNLFHRINDTLSLFSANDGNSNHGIELWRTNGDSTGTYMISDLTPGPASSKILFSSVLFNDKLFFTTDSLNWITFWITDGTPQNTIPLLTKWNATSSLSNVVAVANGIGYFYVAESVDSIFLWRTDGTLNGTFQLMNIKTGLGNFERGATINLNYVFPAADLIHGSELWETDGSVSGTTLLRDLDSNVNSSYPNNFMLLGNRIIFQDYNPQSVWVTDGSNSGTYILGDTAAFPPGCSSYVEGILDNNAYFVVINYNTNTNSIWKTDGTIAGTILLHTFYCDCGYSSYNNIVSAYGLTFFVIDNDQYFGYYSSIWATDGTESGTYEVYANPDMSGAPISELTGACGKIFCDMHTGYYGEYSNVWGVNVDTAFDENLFANTSEMPLILMTDDSLIFFTAIASGYAEELYKLQTCLATPVQNISSPNSLSLFPNPNDGIFTLELPDNLSNAEVRVNDMMGKCRYVNKISSSQNRKLNLQLENIPPGVYSLQIISDDGKWQQLFIKQ